MFHLALSKLEAIIFLVFKIRVSYFNTYRYILQEKQVINQLRSS